MEIVPRAIVGIGVAGCLLAALVADANGQDANWTAKIEPVSADCNTNNPAFPNKELVAAHMKSLASTHKSAAEVRETLAALAVLAADSCRRSTQDWLGKLGWLHMTISDFLSYHALYCGPAARSFGIGFCRDVFVKWKRDVWAREDLTKQITADLEQGK